ACSAWSVRKALSPCERMPRSAPSRRPISRSRQPTTSTSTKTTLTQPVAGAGRQDAPGRSHIEVSVDRPDPVLDAGLIVTRDEDLAVAQHAVGQRSWCVVKDDDVRARR